MTVRNSTLRVHYFPDGAFRDTLMTVQGDGPETE
jgi:hypothetical protein